MGSRTWQLEGGGLAPTSGCRTPGMDSVGLSPPIPTAPKWLPLLPKGGSARTG